MILHRLEKGQVFQTDMQQVFLPWALGDFYYAEVVLLDVLRVYLKSQK